MTEALIVSNLVLWVAVLALLATVFALTRQIGVSRVEGETPAREIDRVNRPATIG